MPVVDSNLRIVNPGNAGVDRVSTSSLQVGQISSIYYVDDVRNLSKQFVEYDVVVSERRGALVTYRNVRRADDGGDSVNFTETVLNPATNKNKVDKDILANGTWVVIGSINGHKDQSVILNTLQHPLQRVRRSKSKDLANKSSSVDERLKKLPTQLPGAAKEDGQRLLGEFMGVRWNINQQGELTVMVQGPKDAEGALTKDFGPSVFKINNKGEIFFLDKLDQEIKISPDQQKIVLTSGGGDSITIDKAAGSIALTSTKAQDQTVGADWTVTVTGNAKIEAKGMVDITGLQVTLNGVAMGDVLTTITDPVIDTIFGAKTVGVPTVKAG